LLLGAIGTLVVVLIVAGAVIGLQRQPRQEVAGYFEELSKAELGKVQPLVEQYVECLETQGTQDALRLCSPEFAPRASFLATHFAGQLRRLEPVELEIERAYRAPDPNEDICIVHCRARGEQDTRTFMLALISIEDAFKVDGLAVLKQNGRRLSASPQSWDALDAVLAVAFERLQSRRHFKEVALTVLLVLALLTFSFLRRRCPACGKLWALKRTTWYYLLWFPDDGMYEYKCKACGEITWLDHSPGPCA